MTAGPGGTPGASPASQRGGEQAARLAALREKVRDGGADSWFSLSAADNFYLSGFTGDLSVVVVTPDDAVLLCDPRFTEQAGDEVRGCRVEELRGSFLKGAGQTLGRLGAGTVGFDADGVTVGQLGQLQAAYDGPFAPVSGLVAGLRLVKSADEVARIRAASELAEGVLADVLAEVKPGVTEMELAARIEYEFKGRGASGPSFPTIALFGGRSSLPHGQPGRRALGEGDVVLVDMGCRVAGYCSDLTRTYSYATIPGIWFSEVYEVVLAAQEAGLGEIRAGARCRDIDAAARGVIDKAGFGKHFGHGLGHGVGIEVHEGPRLNFESEAVLESGMVVTVEPGIYLPGQGGVRIEDLAVVTDNGCDVLTRTSKGLKVLGR